MTVEDKVTSEDREQQRRSAIHILVVGLIVLLGLLAAIFINPRLGILFAFVGVVLYGITNVFVNIAKEI